MAELDFLNDIPTDTASPNTVQPLGAPDPLVPRAKPAYSPNLPEPSKAMLAPAQPSSPVPAAPTDPDFLREIPESRLPIEDNYWRTAQKKPEEAAKVIGLSQRLQAPAKYVEDHLPDLQVLDEAPSPSYWTELAKKAPKTSDFLTDGNNMAVGRTSMENLRQQEHLVNGFGIAETLWNTLPFGFKTPMKVAESLAQSTAPGEMGRALASGAATINAAATRVPALIYDLGAAPQNMLMKAAGRPDLQVTAPDWIRFKDSGDYWDEQARQLAPPELSEDLFKKLKEGDYDAFIKGATLQVLAQAPNQALILAGTAAGLGTPVLVGMGVQQAAQTAHENRMRGADPFMSTLDATTQGIFEGVFEKMGTAGIYEHWAEALASRVGKDSAIKILGDMGKVMAHTFFGEGNEEFWTSLAQNFSAYGYGTDPNAMKGSLGRAINAFIVGGLSGVSMTAPTAGLTGYYRGQEVRRAEQTKKFYEAMGATTEASQLRQVMPAKQKEWLEKVTAGTPVEHIHIDPDDFRSYFQSQNIQPAAIAAQLGLSEQWDEAQKTGADFKIPLATWANEVVGTPHYAGLADDIKLRPDALSNRQAQEVKARVAESLKAETETRQKEVEAAKQDPEWQSVHDAVFKDVYDARIKTGARPELAKHDAQLLADFNIAEALHRGVKPSGFILNGLHITTGLTPEEMAAQRAQAQQPASPAQEQQPSQSDKLAELLARRAALEGQPTSNEATTQELVGLNAEIEKLQQQGGQTLQQGQPEAAAAPTPLTTDTPAFNTWFEGSHVVDEQGKPKVAYSGHSNVLMYGDKFDPKKATAGGYYATEDPEIASKYAVGKIGVRESYENGDQYRLKGKNGKFNKKIWQIQLTPEQQAKAKAFMANEEGRIAQDFDEYIERNKAYDADARRAEARGGSKDLFSIWQWFEHMGYNISYATEGQEPLVQRQQKNSFEELMDSLGIEWTARDWHVPGVVPTYLSIKNPIDTSKPFPPDLLAALTKAAKRERKVSDREILDRHWTRDYPLRNWVEDIKSGNEFWSTQIPKKALPIMQSFGYDGIKDTGGKGGGPKHNVWVAFESSQIKSVFNRGTFDPNDPRILYQEFKQPEKVKEAAQTRDNPAFQRWFEGSQIVDKNGAPLVVYHGGASGISEFDAKKAGTIQRSDWGKGIYFTTSKTLADGYRDSAALAVDEESNRLWNEYQAAAKALGTDVMSATIDLGYGSPGYVKLQEYDKRWRESMERARLENKGEVYPVFLQMKNPYRYTYGGITEPNLADRAKSEGYDGILISNEGGYVEEYIVFEPTQIKSVYNAGTFDTQDPRILYQSILPSRGFNLPPSLPVIEAKEEAGPPHAVFLYNWKISDDAIPVPYFRLYGDPKQIAEQTRTREAPMGNAWGSDVSIDTLKQSGIPVVGKAATATEAPATGQTLFQDISNQDTPAPWNYSQLERAIETKLPDKGTPEQMLGILKNNQVKQDELDWTGVEEWLKDQKGTVTREQVLDFAKANAIRIEEVQKSDKYKSQPAEQADSPEVQRRAEELRQEEMNDAFSDYSPQLPDGYGVEAIDRRDEDIARGSGQNDLWNQPISPLPDQFVVRLDNELTLYDDLPKDYKEQAIEKDVEGVEGVAVFESEHHANNFYYEQIQPLEQEQQNDAEFEWTREHPLEDYIVQAREDLGVTNGDEDNPEDVVGPGPTRWSGINYTLPGGDNYGELLLILPERSKPTVEDTKALQSGGWRVFLSNGTYRDYPKTESKEVAEGLALAPGEYARPIGKFRNDVHFNEDNFIAHVRFDERTVNGKKTLFLQEVQGDWHQIARQHRADAVEKLMLKKNISEEDADKLIPQDYGYRRKMTEEEKKQIEGFSEKINKIDKRIDEIDYKRRGDVSEKQIDEMLRERDDLYSDRTDLYAKISDIEEVEDFPVPAPFKNTWHELAMKRMVRWAAEHGFEQIAWTGSQIQTDRWIGQFRTKVDKVEWEQKGNGVELTVTKGDEIKFKREVPLRGSTQIQGHNARLENLLGTTMASQIRTDVQNGKNSGKFEGKDLEYVDPRPMEGRYDKILPSFANKYGKKWNVKVGDAYLNEPAGTYRIKADNGRTITTLNFANMGDAQDYLAEKKKDYEGYDGATIEEVDPPEPSDKIHILPITPEMRDSVLKLGEKLFQAEPDPAKHRGAITFTADRQAWIQIFKSANESTFAHEAAHFMLQRRFEYVLSGEADEKYMAQWKPLADWLGIKEGQTELTKDQHEMFARGFEQYLREGNAPTPKLAKTFAFFRRWLTKIYPEASDLNVEISPAVRGVMARMLAADEEVTAAEQSLRPDMGAEMENLSPEVRARLSDLAEQAHDEAVSQLLAQQMKEISAENKDRLAQERASITKKAEEEVAQIPEQVAIEALSRSTIKPKNPDKMATAYLDPESGMSEHDRTSFGMIAELTGFSGGDEMAKRILASPSFKAEVAVRVNEHMSQFADLRNSDNIREEALKAIHNERRSELLAAESAAYQTLVDDMQGRAIDRQRRRAEATLELQEIKAQAEQMMRAKPVEDAVQYGPYFTAERKAALNAQKAMIDNLFGKAADWKRKQLLNHALAMESLKTRRQVERWERFLNDQQRKPAESYKKEEHFVQAASLLARFGFQRPDYNPTMKKESLNEWAKRMDEETNGVNIADWLLQNETLTQPYKTLPVEHLNDLVDALRNVQRVANIENTTVSIERGKSIDAIVAELSLIAEQSVPDKSKYSPKMLEGKTDRIKSLLAKYSFSLKKMSTILYKLDGNKDFGRWSDIFWQPVYDAANRESETMRRLNKGLVELWAPYTRAERKALNDEKYYEQLGSNSSKMQLLVMALNLGTEGNSEKLFTTRPVGVPYTKEWNQYVAMDLLEKNLDLRDWEFVQRTWNFINQLWPEAAAMHLDLTGFTPKKVEAKSFNVKLPSGLTHNMAGGYFPLVADPRHSGVTQLRELEETPLYTEQNLSWKAMTKTGYLKGRVAAQYPIALRITTINRHLRDVTHDISFRPTVIDLRRLLNNKAMQETLRRNLGPDGFITFREWLASVAGSTNTDHDATYAWETTVAMMRKKVVAAVLFLKPAIFLQNFANPFLFPGAVEGFGASDAMRGYFVRGLMDYIPKMFNPFDWKSARAMRDFVASKSSLMADRIENPDYSMTETQNKLFGVNSPVREFAGYLMGITDSATNVPMWLEAYHLALARDMTDAQAVRYADRLIDSAVGTGRKYDQPGIMRAGEITKAMAMFYSFWNTEYNRWSKESGKVVAPKDLPRFLGFVASRLILFNMASIVLSGGWPKDEENTLAWWLRQILGYPLQFFPGFRDVANVAMDEMLGLKSYGYRPSPATGVVESGLRGLESVVSYVKGTKDADTMLESLSHATALGVGYPDQINNIFWNAYDIFADGMEPEWRDIYKRRPTKER